jgi:ATP-dependent Clp protease ATP-binding subunit ClpC
VLDLAMMVAGTKYRGQFEERIKAVMNEIKRKARDILLFIDELHTLVGAGGAEGAIDASNVLKPALARGEIQCIGATTLDEYRKYIEKDARSSVASRPSWSIPPSKDETVQILKGLRDKYEAHHRVTYTDDSARVAAVELRDALHHRPLPSRQGDRRDRRGRRAYAYPLTSRRTSTSSRQGARQARQGEGRVGRQPGLRAAADLRDKA